MKNNTHNTLFIDIGGVLMTNGWDHNQRETACKHFNIDYSEFSKLHAHYYNLHEQGKMPLEEYLSKVIFYCDRSFSMEEFKEHMKNYSQPFDDMLSLMQTLAKQGIRIVLVSNEGKDLAEYRIKTFNLKEFCNTFIVSAFIGVQKPNPQFYQIALEIVQKNPEDIIYIDDRSSMVKAGANASLVAFQHKNYLDTKKLLQTYFTLPT